jgi:hypothetical protein
VSLRHERSKTPVILSSSAAKKVQSETFTMRLTAYTIAAAAAGVTALVAIPPAAAEIVFTPTQSILTLGTVLIDLDHNGVNDFVLSVGVFPVGDRRLNVRGLSPRNGIQGYVGPSYPPLALKSGYVIGQGDGFYQDVAPAANVEVNENLQTVISGPFPNVGDRFLGLRFVIDGKTHYGWAVLNVKAAAPGHIPNLHVALLGYAYNTVPNEAIHAGQVSERSSELLPNRGTLAALALGWPVLRRKEEELKSPCSPTANLEK